MVLLAGSPKGAVLSVLCKGYLLISAGESWCPSVNFIHILLIKDCLSTAMEWHSSIGIETHLSISVAGFLRKRVIN